YVALARDQIAAGPAGSSARGEQPKFLATLQPQGTPMLVKFSPPLGTEVGRRWADLLVCEHLAHGVVAGAGLPAARSGLVITSERMFLEVERFDRTPHGRQGFVSMRALDMELVGGLRSWSDTAVELQRQGRIDAIAARAISWLELFGHLIANTDMHGGNLAFLCDGERLGG